MIFPARNLHFFWGFPMAMLVITRWYLWYWHPTNFFCSFCAHISWMLRRLTSRSGRVSSWWSPYAHLKSVDEPQVVPPEKTPERSIGFIASFELRIYHLYPFISSHITFFPIWLFVTWKSWGFHGLLTAPGTRQLRKSEKYRPPWHHVEPGLGWSGTWQKGPINRCARGVVLCQVVIKRD